MRTCTYYIRNTNRYAGLRVYRARHKYFPVWWWGSRIGADLSLFFMFLFRLIALCVFLSPSLMIWCCMLSFVYHSLFFSLRACVGIIFLILFLGRRRGAWGVPFEMRCCYMLRSTLGCATQKGSIYTVTADLRHHVDDIDVMMKKKVHRTALHSVLQSSTWHATRRAPIHGSVCTTTDIAARILKCLS